MALKGEVCHQEMALRFQSLTSFQVCCFLPVVQDVSPSPPLPQTATPNSVLPLLPRLSALPSWIVTLQNRELFFFSINCPGCGVLSQNRKMTNYLCEEEPGNPDSVRSLQANWLLRDQASQRFSYPMCPPPSCASDFLDLQGIDRSNHPSKDIAMSAKATEILSTCESWPWHMCAFLPAELVSLEY